MNTVSTLDFVGTEVYPKQSKMRKSKIHLEVKIKFKFFGWKKVEPGVMCQLYSVCTELELPFSCKNSSEFLKKPTISNLNEWIDCAEKKKCLEYL